jgi:hypothetical protein
MLQYLNLLIFRTLIDAGLVEAMLCQHPLQRRFIGNKLLRRLLLHLHTQFKLVHIFRLDLIHQIVQMLAQLLQELGFNDLGAFQQMNLKVLFLHMAHSFRRRQIWSQR